MILIALAAVTLSTSDPFELDSLEREPTPRPTAAEERHRDRERYLERGHTELSFGYLGEWRDDSQHGWELTAGREAAPSAASLLAPFAARPFSGFRAAGMGIESRTVWDGVRFTVGLRWPFASYRVTDTLSTVELGGAPRTVAVRSLALWEVRTGLGFELPFRIATPFVDVLGDVQNLSASVTIDDAPTTWRATGFALGVRTGVRLQVSNVFVVLAGEATVLGAPRVGGLVQAGVAF